MSTYLLVVNLPSLSFGVRVLEDRLGSGGHGGDFLAVAADLPLEARAPMVGDFTARDLAAVEAEGGRGLAFEFLIHR